jgi:exopolysaccharide biosynthesis polyprenyl glycosylphosphotransferase
MAKTTVEGVSSVRLEHAEPRPRSLWRLRWGTASWGQMSLATDAAMLTAALVLAELTQGRRVPETPVVWMVTFALLVLAFLYSQGMYRPPLQLRILDGSRAVVTASALAAAIVIWLRVAWSDSSFVAVQNARAWLFATAFLVAGRIALSLSEKRARRAGEAGHPTLIVGAGKVGRLVATRLREHPEIGLIPVGFLDKEPLYTSDEIEPPVLGASWDLERIVEEKGIEHLIITFSSAPTEVLLRLQKRCEHLGVRTSVVPRLYEKATERSTVDSLGGLPLVSSHPANPKGWQFAGKHAFDRVAATFALVLLTPALAALAIAVYVSSGRPIFYRAERIGRDGRKFDMLKFRSMNGSVGSMNPDLLAISDRGTGGVNVEGVDRRTRLGQFMRRWSLDELPQLFNVLKGDMSVIGPRPERTEFVEVYERTVYRYGERHRVKSGITGWAQVNGLRGSTSLADRIEWDNYYIENWSLWLDFKIFLLTLVAVARPADSE